MYFFVLTTVELYRKQKLPTKKYLLDADGVSRATPGYKTQVHIYKWLIGAQNLKIRMPSIGMRRLSEQEGKETKMFALKNLVFPLYWSSLDNTGTLENKLHNSYLKIFPWLKARPSLSAPVHEKYCSTFFFVSSDSGSNFSHE